MKIPQHPYLTPAAQALRARDGITPWGVHPCEVDSIDGSRLQAGPFRDAWEHASRIREEIETQPA